MILCGFDYFVLPPLDSFSGVRYKEKLKFFP